jgi:hypothetical protein
MAHKLSGKLLIAIACLILIVGIVGISLWISKQTVVATIKGHGIMLPSRGVLEISSPVSGLISDLPISIGAHVVPSEEVALVNTDTKKRVTVLSYVDGTVVNQFIHLGEFISVGEPIFELFPSGSPISGILFVPASTGKSIAAGMTSYISPFALATGKYGSIKGYVANVSPLPVAYQQFNQILGIRPNLIKQLSRYGPLLEIVVSLSQNKRNLSGYNWTSGSGPSFPVKPGTLIRGTIELGRYHP